MGDGIEICFCKMCRIRHKVDEINDLLKEMGGICRKGDEYDHLLHVLAIKIDELDTLKLEMKKGGD